MRDMRVFVYAAIIPTYPGDTPSLRACFRRKANPRASLLANLLFARDRLPADVAAAKAIRPIDLVDSGIGACLGFRHGLATRTDIEHATAIGDDRAILFFGSGVEYLDAVELGGGIETADHGAFFVTAWISLGGHDHGERCIGVPTQIEMLQLSVARGDQRW